MPDLENPYQNTYKEISSCLLLYTVVFEGCIFGDFSPSPPFLLFLYASLGNRNTTLIPLADLFCFMTYFLGVGKTSIARSIARALNRQVL